jgi:methanogenic corrinoid protein MtbC1
MISFVDVQARYMATLRAGDRRAAIDVIERARADGAGIERLYLDVLQPSLREVGRLWQVNEMSVAEEHMATAITQMVMARLYDDILAESSAGTRTAIAACAETERHEVGLRMVCDLLERAGWDATFLGASVPAEALVRMVRERAPDAVVLSASIAPHLPQLRATISAIRDATGDAAPYIMVGGRPFLDDDSLASRVGADATATDAALAVERLRARWP